MVRNALRSAQDTTQQIATQPTETQVILLGTIGTTRAYSSSMSKRARNPEQGMNWIRLSTRMAIYHRDGFCCVYCGHAAEMGHGLTLDHLLACELGGSNAPTNLVTCCRSCNSAKGALTQRTWLARLADPSLARRVRRQAQRKLDRAEGRRLAAMRKDA